MKKALAAFVVLVLGAGAIYIFVLFDANNKLNATRAEKCYGEGETFFNQKKYKAALMSYEDVTEFYSTPRTKWVDLAQEKEWICRAYLNDWTSAKGKWNGDLREMKPHLYEKYKAELMVITPVSEDANTENAMASMVQVTTMGVTPVSQGQTVATTSFDLGETPTVVTTPTDQNQTPTAAMPSVDTTPTPAVTAVSADPTPTP